MHGEVSEWFMVPLSKSGLHVQWSVGSNPTLSAGCVVIFGLVKAFRENGEMLEWTIRLAWRASVAFGYRGFESHSLRHSSQVNGTAKAGGSY